jgi:hypothetical protein
MYTQIIKQASAVGVASNTTATARIPTSGTQYGVFLFCKQSGGAATPIANIKSSIGDITIYHNGEQIMLATATFFLDMQKYYFDALTGGASNVAGIIPIPFAPYHFNNFAERQLFAVGTANLQTITINISCLTLSSLVSIDIYSEVDPSLRNRAQHIRIKRYPQSFATTGTHEIPTLPLEGATVGYKCLHIELGTNPGVSDYVTFKVGGFAIYDTVVTALNTVYSNFCGRTPQAAYTYVDFGKNNAITSFLPMAGIQDIRLLVDWTTTPTSYNVYAEEIFGLNAPTTK